MERESISSMPLVENVVVCVRGTRDDVGVFILWPGNISPLGRILVGNREGNESGIGCANSVNTLFVYVDCYLVWIVLFCFVLFCFVLLVFCFVCTY